MVSFRKVLCGSLTLTHEALFLIPFLFNCPRCIVVLQNRGRIFAGNGCKWRGNVIKLCGSNGIRRCTQVVEGSGFEIVWSVRFCGSRTPWYLGPFRICCLRSAEELLHIFLRFAKRGGCEWGAILRVTSGTHKFSSNHYSKWLEISAGSGNFVPSKTLANSGFSKFQIEYFYVFSPAFLSKGFLSTLETTRVAGGNRHGAISKWS